MHLDHEVTELELLPGRMDGLADTEPVTAEEEHEELGRVLLHPAINRSANLVRFLQFVCAKYFEGEAEDIRERTVAVEALGRKEATFDSHADPIVRVTARDLRKKLDDFYANEGRSHRVQIVLPRGRYIPQFLRRPSREEMERSDSKETSSVSDRSVTGTLGRSEDAARSTEEHQKVAGRGFPWNTAWKTAVAALVVSGAFTAGLWVGRHQVSAKTIAVPISWSAPAWSDEFDGPAQQAPSPANWINDGSPSDRSGAPCAAGTPCASALHHVFLDGAGHLVLRASRSADGSWTTAKLSTGGLHNFEYGRIEARMKLPVGVGLWPAFWLMGANFPKVGWPNAGSVDVMENVASQHGTGGLGPSVIRSTLHGPAYFGQTGLLHDYKLPGEERVDDGFHTYGIIWSPQRMQFYVDDPGNVYFEKDASDLPQGAQWVFDQPFYLVLDLAVGGEWPGSADNTTPNPADMIVDYVRVYDLPAALRRGKAQ